MGIAALATTLLFSPAPALAYIGPGAGLGAIGATLGLLLSVLLLLVGVVWYPLKRLLRSRRADAAKGNVSPSPK